MAAITRTVQRRVIKIYSWSENATDELWWNNTFETVEECIEDAKSEWNRKKTGDEIAIGTIVPYVVSADVDCMLEQLEQDAYEECGDAAYDWNISSRKGHEKEFDELQEKVTVLVNEYLEKIGEKPSFCKIEDIYTVIID